jgi:hypothetical protein
MLTGALTSSIGAANPTGWSNEVPFLTTLSILSHVELTQGSIPSPVSVPQI